MLKTFRIHYIEKGDGKRIGGRIYNGKRHMSFKAATETNAIKKLRERYVEDGIREIISVEEIVRREEAKHAEWLTKREETQR